jgi:hypothetical protein
VVAGVFLAAFNQIFDENQEQKNRAERFEKLAVWPERKHI